jgi:hypothetical protein
MTRLGRLQTSWVYGGFLAGLMILVLTPLLVPGWGLPGTLAFLVLPVYMLHQYEEHDDDRFHRFVDTEIGKGRDVLPTPAIFLINIVGVWVTMIVVLWLMRAANPAWGVVAGYVVLVNGIVHLVAWAVLRRYNPGLVTGIVLFLPLGAAILWLTPAGIGYHLAGLVYVVGVHVGIIVDARRKLGTAPLCTPDPANGGRLG